MTKETIRALECLRNLTDSEWDEIMSLLESKVISGEKDSIKNISSRLSERVRNLIREIGVPSNLLGYVYIQRALVLRIQNPKNNAQITTSIYPQIAKENDSNVPRVERAIRHAIEKVFSEGNSKKIGRNIWR